MMGDIELDLAAALGAEPAVSLQVLSIYLPNKDRYGTEFDASPWIKEAGEMLFRIGGGATVMPPQEGVTADESGVPLWESTVVVYTYVTDALVRELPALRAFLHRYGRTTNQREVGVSLAGEGQSLFLRITRFD
jgi:hypothetical protein